MTTLRSVADGCSHRYRSSLHFFDLGARGERAGRKYLKRKGFHIRHCNWRCALGEIDIVAQRKDVLVFLEVKSRKERASQYFDPVEAVDEAKKRKIKTLAEWYLRDFELEIKYRRLRRQRFDVVAVLYRTNCLPPKVRHYENVF